MAWIESHQELARHPKTLRLARLLGVQVAAAIGHLHLLWWWAMSYAQNGDLSRFPDEDLAEAMLWDGEPVLLAEALMGAGFLDDGRQIHDWDEYAGRLVERREAGRKANAERQRKHRERQAQAAKDVATRPRNAPVTRDGNAARVTVTGLPDPTGPDRTQPNPTGPDRAGPAEHGGGAGGTVAADAAPPPSSARVREIRPVPKPEPRPDRFAEVLDAIKALDPSVVVGGDRDRNAKAVNGSQAPPELIAEAYVAQQRGEWDDPFVRKRGSLHAVVDNIGGYIASRKGGERNGSSGQRARGGNPIRHV